MENDMIHRNVFAKVTVPKTEAEEREPIDQATRKQPMCDIGYACQRETKRKVD